MSYCNSKETTIHDLVTERRRASNLGRFKLKYNKEISKIILNNKYISKIMDEFETHHFLCRNFVHLQRLCPLGLRQALFIPETQKIDLY